MHRPVRAVGAVERDGDDLVGYFEFVGVVGSDFGECPGAEGGRILSDEGVMDCVEGLDDERAFR